MPVASAPSVRLSARQQRVLEQVARAASTPQVIATRARIVLAAADGASNRGLAHQLHLARNTAQAWRDRWLAAAEALAAAEVEGGDEDDRALRAVVLGVLADAPRPGAPPTFTPEQLCQIMAVACEPPGDSGRPISQWTSRELADEASKRGIVARISARTVGRFLVSGGGRGQAPPEPVLAHAPRNRSAGARGADRGRVHGVHGGPSARRPGRARGEHG
jgi:putative transposase